MAKQLKQFDVSLAFNADTSQAKREMQKLQRDLDNLLQSASKSSGAFTLDSDLHKASQAAIELKQHIQNAINVETGQLDVGALSSSFAKAGTSLEDYRQKLSKLGPEGNQAFVSVAKSILNAEVPLKRTNTLLSEFATTLKNTARWQISSSLLHGFMGSLQHAYGYAQDLNESLNNIRIVTGNSTEQMAQFAQEANKAAQALSTTTTEYTNASLIYYQQGLSNEEVKERTDVTIKMANVTRESAETVSDQMTAVWNNFDDGSKSLEYYADVMTALGAATASSTAEISEGLNKFAAVANTVGLSYEYATAALTTVTATTRQSADIVGNAFKTLFARIQGLNLGETLEDGTDLNKYSEALAAVGINIKNQAGELKDMNTILDEMGAKWGTLAKDQQVALAETVAGARQYTQLIALMDNWDFFQQNLDTASGAEGALQKQADIYAESWEAARDRVTAAAEEIYSQLLNDNFFIDLTDGFAKFLGIISDTIDALGGLQGVLSGLGILITQVYGESLAATLSNFFTTQQQRQQQWLHSQEEALTGLEKVMNSEDFREAGSAYESIADSTRALVAESEHLTAEQQEQYKLGLKQLRSRAEAVAQYEMMVHSAEKELAAAQEKDEIARSNLAKATSEKVQTIGGIDIAQTRKAQKAITAYEEVSRTIAGTGEEARNATAEFQALVTAMGGNVEAATAVAEAIDEESIALRGVDNAATAATNAENNLQEARIRLKGSTKDLEVGTKYFIKSLEEARKPIPYMSEEIIGLAQGLMSLSMALSTIKGLKDIWSDKDASYWEKFLSSITAISMALPMVITGFRTLRTSMADLPAALTLFAKNMGSASATSAIGAGTTLGLGAAFKEAAVGVLTYETALGPLGWVLLGITAATVTLAVAGKALYDSYNADAIAAKEAAKEAEKLAETYNNVKSAYDDLKSSLDDYNSARDALDKLITGTQEWKDAVQDLNQQIVDLLDKYPQLAQYVTDTDGRLSISKEGQEQLLKEQSAHVQDAYQANLMAQARAKSTANQSTYTDFGRDNDTYYVASSAVEKAVEAINTQGDAILKNSDALMKAADISKEQAEALLQNRDGLISLVTETKANTEAIKVYKEQLGHSLLEEAKNDNNVTIHKRFEDQLAHLVGQKAQQLYEDTYYDKYKDKIGGYRDKTIQQEYAELMGYTWVRNKSGNKGEYLVNGEAKTISDAEARDALAQDAAQKDAKNEIQTYTAALQELTDKTKEASPAVLDFITGVDQGIDNLNADDVAALKDLDLSKLSEETKEALNLDTIGFSLIQQTITSNFNKALTDIREGMTQSSLDIYKSLDLSDVTVSGRKAIADTLDRAIALGSQDTTKLIKDVFSTPGVDAQEFADALSQIDWNTTSVDNLRNSLKEAGVSTNYTDTELQHLIDTMHLASDSVSNLQEQYAAIHKIIDDLGTGDTISSEDFFALGDAVDGYFTQMMDGTYKLTGDAEEFYKLVQDQQIQKFKKSVSELEEKNAGLQNISGYDFDNLKQSAVFQSDEGKEVYYPDTVQQQLDILRELGEQSEDAVIKVGKWKDQLDHRNLTSEDLQEIANAVADCQSQFENLDETMANNDAQMLQTNIAIASSYDNLRDLRQALEDGTISSLEAFNTAAVNLDKVKDIEDLDPEELSEFSQYLQDIADSSDDLVNNMSDNASKIVAKSIMKMNDGIDELANNWENWSSILEDSQSSAEEYSEAMSGMRDAMANLLDINEEFIDADFIKDNMEDVKLAAEGDTEAIDRLKQALIDPVVAKIAVDNEVNETELMSQVTNLQSLLDEMGPIKLGTDVAEIDNVGFIDACNDMIAQSQMTTDQVNAIFDAMGFDATFESTNVPVTYQVPLTTTKHTRTINDTDKHGNPTDWTESEQIVSSELVPYEGSYTAFAISTNGETPTITGATKKATGASNNYSSFNKGGTASPSGKSGDSGKEKSKETKDHKEADDELDRYWDINNAIKATSNRFEELSDEMEKTQTVEDHLFGKALIANLKQQNEQLERENALVVQQKSNYQALYAEQRRELSELESKLSGFGAQFNGDALTNYSSLLSGALAAYNAAIDAYNASAQEDADKLALEAAEKQYTEIKETIDRYRDLYYTDMADTQDKLRDLEQQELENRLKILKNNLKSWEVEIELKLDITEAKRKWDEFLKEVEQDFRKIYKDLTVDSKFDRNDFFTYVDDIGTTMGAIRSVEAEMNKLKNGGSSDMFYDITEAQEKLKELQEQLIENGKSLTELYQQVWTNYIDGLDQVQNKLEDIDKQYERIDDELEYEKELIELLYGDKAYALMDKYYKAQSKNILAQIDSMRTQVNFWQSEFNKAYQMNKDKHNVNLNDMSTWTEDMQKAYKNMQDAQANLNDLILKGVKLLQEDYLNAINEVIDTMDKNIWGVSLDDLKDNWDRIQKIADEYLDDVEGAYKIQALANKIDQSIANTSSLQSQQKLQKLREEEIEMLREKENLTQDDIDLAEARYQIALKEIALEEAQQNKTSMKLTRDTSGNWTYQYVADEEDIMTKQQELLDAYNNLYQTADEAYAHAMELAMDTYETMQEKIREIAEDMTLSEEEKMQRIQEIYDTYLPEIEAAVGNSELYRQEAMMATAAVFAEVCEQDEEAYDTLTNAQKEMVDAVKDNHLEDYEEIRSAIVDGVYPELNDAAKTTFEETNMNSKTAAADIITDWAKNNGSSVRSMINTAINDMQKHIQNYEKELDNLQKIAGANFDKLGQMINKTSDKINNLNDKTKQLCDDSAGYLSALRSYVDEVAKAWDRVIAQIQTAKAELGDYLSLQFGGSSSGGSSGGSGNTSGGGSGSGSTGGTSGSGSGGGDGKLSVGDTTTFTGQYYYDSYGLSPIGSKYSGVANGVVIDNVNNNPYGIHIHSADGKYGDLGWVKKSQLSGYDTGGYTGEWDNTGRLAFLHQKELVLNADDTSNILKAVSAIRDLTSLNGSISSAIATSIGSMAMNLVANGGGNINTNSNSNAENQFYITAEFPNANDVETIREAILSLPNLASQYIHKNK